MGIEADIDAACADIAERVVIWRHHLHQHPELPNREERTAHFIADHLNSLNLDEVRTGIAGHGVVGVLHGAGDRVIALRADIDALPVKETSGVDFASTVVDGSYPGGPFPVAHACGHDCHTAMLMGAASVLSAIREHLEGTVLFVFQPAEEGPPLGEKGGAREMAAQGALSDPVPTMVYGHHVVPFPKGYIAYRKGNQYSAACVVRVDITGEQVHGSTPWEGIDPMPAAGAIMVGVGQLYREVSAFNPVTVSIGHVQDTGRYNIIGGSVTLLGTIRCNIAADMTAAQKHLTRLVKGLGDAYGCATEVAFEQEVAPVHNTAAWIDAALPTFKRVAGEHVVECPPTLGSDDVSVFLEAHGGVYVGLGVQDVEITEGGLRPTPGGRGLVVNHNPGFYADDDTLLTGVRLHTAIAVDHLAGRLEPA